MNLGPHSAFIWSAYAAVGVGLSALVGWLIHDGRRQQALLDDLEARGVRRRTSRDPMAEAATPDVSS